MDKPLNKTFSMLKVLLKRDWLKLVFWIVGVLAFAASGVGKFELIMQTTVKEKLCLMFFKDQL